MARISSIPLDDKTYRRILDSLDGALAKLKKEEVRFFLFSLLGKNERIMVAKRFCAVLLLKQGYKMSDIERVLKITRPTLIKLSLVMQVKNQGFDIVYKKIGNQQMKEEVREILNSLVKGSAEMLLKYKIKPPLDLPPKHKID